MNGQTNKPFKLRKSFCKYRELHFYGKMSECLGGLARHHRKIHMTSFFHFSLYAFGLLLSLSFT